MDNFFYIEIILVGAVLLLQVLSGFKTYGFSKRLSGLLPFQKNYSLISKVHKAESTLTINQITLNKKTSKEFEGIVSAINIYLERNKAAASDFHLIKDLIERAIDTEEENVRHNLTVPLYLGLMGTMAGIVFGLFQMFMASGDVNELNINAFLQGVAIAMFASLLGLGITVFNSNWAFRNAKVNLERAKNLFYDFIQTELLPVVNESVMSNVHNLNKTLSGFNADLSANLDRLSDLFTRNFETLKTQDKVLTELNNLDITAFVKANETISKELRTSTKKFEQFNKYLEGLTYLATSTTKLTVEFDRLLQGSNHFKELAQKLDERVDENNRMVQFFNENYKQLVSQGGAIDEMAEKTSGKMLDALDRISDNIPRALEGYREHLDQKVAAIKEMAITEADLMARSYSKQEKYLEKLELLGELRTLIQELNRINKENKSVFENGLRFTGEAIKSMKANSFNSKNQSGLSSVLKDEQAVLKKKINTQSRKDKRESDVIKQKKASIFKIKRQRLKRFLNWLITRER
jgi:Mg2+ and Co2+ transporter CorA